MQNCVLMWIIKYFDCSYSPYEQSHHISLWLSHAYSNGSPSQRPIFFSAYAWQVFKMQHLEEFQSAFPKMCPHNFPLSFLPSLLIP